MNKNIIAKILVLLPVCVCEYVYDNNTIFPTIAKLKSCNRVRFRPQQKMLVESILVPTDFVGPIVCICFKPISVFAT